MKIDWRVFCTQKFAFSMLLTALCVALCYVHGTPWWLTALGGWCIGYWGAILFR